MLYITTNSNYDGYLDLYEMIENVKKIIPSLTSKLHKGSCGRIGIIGGSTQYTGAPYFAGISSIKTGADLCYIFTHSMASQVIKSYSPELIVYPGLEFSDDMEVLRDYMNRLSVLIVGCGLSKDRILLHNSMVLIQHAKKLNIPVIIDADALDLVCKYPTAFKGNTNFILTPNFNEFKKMKAAFNIFSEKNDYALEAELLSEYLGNITIVLKGNVDVITNGKKTILCDAEGGLKRCGGQGDLLAGSMGTFLAWSVAIGNQEHLDAAWGACILIKGASKAAFKSHSRSTTASDMIPYLSTEFKRLFET